jgi:hypothetical protein
LLGPFLDPLLIAAESEGFLSQYSRMPMKSKILVRMVLYQGAAHRPCAELRPEEFVTVYTGGRTQL